MDGGTTDIASEYGGQVLAAHVEGERLTTCTARRGISVIDIVQRSGRGIGSPVMHAKV